MKKTCQLIFLFCLLISRACWALVNPESTTLPVPGWSADIFVVGKNNTYSFYCKGSLIASQWVLSASLCYYDPFKARETAANRSDPTFVIRLGDSETYLEVDDQIESDDYAVTMWRLVKPVANVPLRLSSRKGPELLDTTVQILGTQSSQAAKHIIYNPWQGANITCKVDGTAFYTDDTLCYLLGKTTASTTMLSTSGIIIDPKAPGAPNSWLDKAVTINTSGAEFYVDFRKSDSYPCHEDLGAPVLARNATGEFEQVGVFAGTSVVVGLPMCTQTIANEFRSISHYQPFITETMLDHEFKLLCPPAPKPRVQYTGATGITLSWPAVEGATGYRIHYTNEVGYTPIQVVDVRNQTQVSTTLNSNFVYTASVTAYSDGCSSPLSDLVTIGF